MKIIILLATVLLKVGNSEKAKASRRTGRKEKPENEWQTFLTRATHCPFSVFSECTARSLKFDRYYFLKNTTMFLNKLVKAFVVFVVAYNYYIENHL